ncbi:hypothetical protein NEUTE2DRAFT_129919 [Neurospora tetrasperma FGSC 2509]|nr:hypothetical protein NEUTE2DRAFT_129919 [Neurospora tetrasperma FGSC 2509]
MSEPRNTTVSPFPEGELGPSPGTESDQIPSPPGPLRGPEASVSKPDEVLKSADVADNQDQHSKQ